MSERLREPLPREKEFWEEQSVVETSNDPRHNGNTEATAEDDASTHEPLVNSESCTERNDETVRDRVASVEKIKPLSGKTSKKLARNEQSSPHDSGNNNNAVPPPPPALVPDDSDSYVPAPPQLNRQTAQNMNSDTPGAFSVTGQQMERRNTGFISPQERPYSKEFQLKKQRHGGSATQEACAQVAAAAGVSLAHGQTKGDETTSVFFMKRPISRKMIFIVAVAAALIISGVVVVVVFSTARNNDSSAPTTPKPTTENSAPTLSPSTITEREDSDGVSSAIRNALMKLSSTQESLSNLPDDPTFYLNMWEDESQSSSVRALSWALFEDPLELGPNEPELVSRYALACLYYATNGSNWTNSRGWLTQLDACGWQGVFCQDPDNVTYISRIIELDLQDENLRGSLPNDIALLSDLETVWLGSNMLTGTVPAQALHDIAGLKDLRLDNNKFEGEIDEILAQGRLSSLHIQGNDFEVGSPFPAGFCNGTDLILDDARLDCDVLVCGCCLEEQHCF